MVARNGTEIPTVSVLIPAYNEASGIKKLLAQVVSQTEDSFILDKIFVYSDGSTDATTNEAQSIIDTRIRVINETQRGGLAVALNTLFRQTESDIAVILNADISLADNYVLRNLVAPIYNGQADLTAALIQELPPKSFVESILATSMAWKKDAFLAWKGGSNIFTCFGPARAYSRRLYSAITFPFGACDDAYSYLFCTQQGFTFKLVQAAKIYYRLPSTLSDHVRQSVRYTYGMKKLEEIFGKEMLHKEKTSPIRLLVTSGLHHIFIQPVLFTAYIILSIGLLLLRPFLKIPDLYTWRIATSSKVSTHI